MNEENKDKPVRKKPMTTEEFFNKICEILKEKELMPDILDYALATSDPVPMTTYEFNIRNNLDFGGSEGIYIDLWIEYYRDNEKVVNDLGTFKTLREDREGMQIMGKLLADFILGENAYVNANLDDFTWKGADVHPIDGDGKRLSWGYSCQSMESALKKKDELLDKYPSVIVRDNATREETVYKSRHVDL